MQVKHVSKGFRDRFMGTEGLTTGPFPVKWTLFVRKHVFFFPNINIIARFRKNVFVV